MSELATVMERVNHILRYYPECRNSDKIILEMYYSMYEGVLTELSKVDVSPESVTRARRKLQADNEELRAVPEVEEAREERQQTFKETFGGRMG